MFQCLCGKEFEGKWQLIGHKGRCGREKPFELLKQDATRKSRLIDERGHRCEVCTNDVWNQKPIPIELDHIDGNPENNDKANLRLICPNCHAQTETYKGRNIGKVTNTKRSATLKKYYGRYR